PAKSLIHTLSLHDALPILAIVTDVTHDTSTPKMSKNKEGDLKCGDGPVVTYAPAVQNNLRELIIDAAEEKKIPFQRAASSRVTGDRKSTRLNSSHVKISYA